MKEIIDNFSNQFEIYKNYRPIYPDKLYDAILPFVKEKEQCWDCGTGNGQVALKLSNYFNKVYAKDISEKRN